MDGSSLVVALVALAFGALIGWLFAGRQSGGLKAARDGLSERFKSAVTDLAAEAEARQAADIRLAALPSAQKAPDAAHDAQTAPHKDAQSALTAPFPEVGQGRTDSAQKNFLKR